MSLSLSVKDWFIQQHKEKTSQFYVRDELYQEATDWHFIYAFKKEPPCFIKTHLSPNTTFCIKSLQLSCIRFTWSLKEFKSMPLRFQTYPSSLSTITVWLFCHWNPSEVRRLLLKHVSLPVSLSLIKQSAFPYLFEKDNFCQKSISKHSAKPFHPFYYLYAHTHSRFWVVPLNVSV